jgi:hypothetical protein
LRIERKVFCKECQGLTTLVHTHNHYSYSSEVVIAGLLFVTGLISGLLAGGLIKASAAPDENQVAPSPHKKSVRSHTN